jgi:hypothetical protein
MSSPTLYVCAAFLAVILAALAGFSMVRLRLRRARAGAAAMEAAIDQYFKKLGVAVSIECKPVGKDGYVAFIESEPMKQLRLSHIIEASMRDQLHNLYRMNLDKVYWRFPFKEQPHESVVKPKDEYITEGLAHTRYLPKVEAQETTWESFEDAGSVPAKSKRG